MSATVTTPAASGAATAVIPTRHESYKMPMTALRKCHPHLYADKSNYGRRQLVWEKLWSTTSNDYGSFCRLDGRKYTNQRRGDVWMKQGYDTSNRQIGDTHARQTQAMLCSRHMSADVLKVDADADDVTKPQSPLKKAETPTAAAATPAAAEEPRKAMYPKRDPVQPKSHPQPHLMRAVQGQPKVIGDITQINRSRPNLTSGYAKQYVRSTEGPFWSNLESMRE